MAYNILKSKNCENKYFDMVSEGYETINSMFGILH